MQRHIFSRKKAVFVSVANANDKSIFSALVHGHFAIVI